MRKIFCFYWAFTLVGVNMYGQAPGPSQNLLPRITTPSPEAAAFGKYGNFDVNLFNGTPNIAIPLYEINVGELKVPISISYNASGIKVGDIPTNIGCGWSLNAGGTISRKVMGLPDEYSANYRSNSGINGYLNGGMTLNASQIDPNTQIGLDYLRNIVNKQLIDAEPDVFSYNIPGKSGKFVFIQQDNINPLFIPYERLTVSPIRQLSNTMFLTMVNEAGIKFDFNSFETSINNGQPVPGGIISSWQLTKMMSSNSQDSIKFNYSNGPTLSLPIPQDNITVIDQVWINPGMTSSVYSPSPGQPPLILYGQSDYLSQKNLDSINFVNGKIVFQLAAESRLDFGMSGLKNRLQKIRIYSYDGAVYNLVKEIEFYHSYLINKYGWTDSSLTRRLKLDSLIVRDAAGANIQKYKFDYNSRTDIYGLPSRDAKAIDYWGYYNGKLASTLVPRTDITYAPFSGSVGQTISIGAPAYGTRDPDPSYMNSGILTRITYPTGGYSTFEYETNQYSPTNLAADAKFAGGLRIKKIKSFDAISPVPLIKYYVYGQNESGFGTKNFVLDNYFMFTNQSRRYWDWTMSKGQYPQVGATESVRTFFANPTMDIETYDAVPVAYQYVTEYSSDAGNNNGKVIYQFNYSADGLSLTQYYGGTPFILTNHYHRGQVLFKTVYRQNPDLSYTMISQTENHYAAFPDTAKTYSALSVTHTLFSDGTNPYVPGSLTDNMPANTTASEYNASNEYTFFSYSIQSGDNRLTQTTERIYDQNDPAKILTSTVNTYYDNYQHLQPTRTSYTNSKGEVIIDSLKYPHEFSQAGNVYQALINRNILNKVIQDKKTNNSMQINLKLTNYADWGNNNLLPQNIQIQVGANPIETRATFNSYDQRGNIQEMQKSNDQKYSYIWDYSKIHSIAEVSNGAFTDIAYSSFEANGTGNWNISSPVRDNTQAITGKQAYSLSNGSINKNGLDPSKTYVVSYWSRGGVFNVNGAAAITGTTVNGWTYYEHQVANPAGGTITITGNGLIDELRLYPFGALMTSYTYTPLIGMTSQCDPSNRITYYEYDGLGRLKVIRDINRNILKLIDYQNLSGPVINLYYNALQAGTYQKTDCTGGYVGSWVTYIVPANKYYSYISQADVDQLANNDVISNGPAYANANGICSPPPIVDFTYGNSTGDYIYLALTNISSGQIFNFTLSSYSPTGTIAGQIPVGTYNASFSSSNGSALYRYRIYDMFQMGVNSATMSGVSLCTTCANASVDAFY